MSIFTPNEVINLIANAYFEAAQRNANMYAVTASLEAVRITFLNEDDDFSTWTVLDEHVGRAEEERFQPILIKLREKFEQTLIKQKIERLSGEFQQDRNVGWTSWLKTYVAGLTANTWRLSFCLALTEASLPFPPDLEPSIEKIRYYTRCILHERWAETYPWFMFLAAQNILPEQQAKFLVNASEIQIYHLLNFEEAKELLDRAKQIAPKEIRVLSGWGEYWLEQNDFEQAESAAREIIETAPLIEDGYLLLGDCYAKSDKLDEAESQYKQALSNASGQGNGYTRLMSLYGRREWFDRRGNQLPNLIKRAIAIDPTSAYTLYLTEGEVYQQNNLNEDAHRCYDNAIRLNNTRLSGYTAHGYLYLAEKRFDEARASFEQVIEVAPEALDGYWGMIWLCEQQQAWQEALDWCDLSLARRPEWESIICARQGEIYRQSGEYSSAETELLRALELDLNNQQAVDSLHTLADDYYMKMSNSDAARHLYQSLRELKGESYEANYQNRLGNLNYYNNKHLEAAAAYRKAIVAEPLTAVYHSNLALALDKQKMPGERLNKVTEAITALQEADRLNLQQADRDDYTQRLKRLEQELRMLPRYGESIAKLLPIATPIKVYTETSMLPYILDREGKNLLTETAQSIDRIRSQIQNEFGVKIPGIRFTDYQDSRNPGSYYFGLMDTTMTSYRNVVLDKKFLPGLQTDLHELQVTADRGLNPLGGQGYWINRADWENVERAGQELWTVPKYLIEDLKVLLQSNLALFITHQDVWNLLNSCPVDACTEIKQSTEKLTAMVQVLKALVIEQTPIIALESICTEFLAQYQPDLNLAEIVEHLRSLPEIRDRLPGNQPSFTFYQFEKSLEQKLEACIFSESHQFCLAMTPALCQDVLSAIRSQIAAIPDADLALLVNSSRLRPLLRKLMELEFPLIHVLCRSELLDGLKNQIVESPRIG
jgi:tetratricopeptide (TPR) repeat protein